jgi:hypothetical protein
MKKFLADKKFGFYVTFGLVILSIVTAIVYAVSYRGFYSGGKEVFSHVAFWILLGMVAADIVLAFFKQTVPYLGYVTALGGLLALCFYLYGIYYYVTVMVTGIDAVINFKFVFNTILFVLVWVGSLADFFFPQIKEEEMPVKEAQAA